MSKRLYVGSLPYDVTEDQIHDLFGQHGKVASTKLIRDKFSGQSRGFAFVEMETEEGAKSAIEKLNGSPFGDRKMIVNEAKPKEEWSGSRGGGGERGGGSGFGGGYGGRRSSGGGRGGYGRR